MQRGELRRIPLDSLPTGTVGWGHKAGGTSFVDTHLYDADTRHTAAAKVVGGGSTVARESGGWAPELTALITDTDTAPLLRPHYALSIREAYPPPPPSTATAPSRTPLELVFAPWLCDLTSSTTTRSRPRTPSAGFRWRG